MDHRMLTAILIVLTLNKITAESIHFKMALMNDLNSTCVEQKGFTTVTAASASEDCVQEALLDLYKRRSEVNHNEERISLLCTTDITKECNHKFLDVVLPCLPEVAHEVVVKMTDVNYQGTASLCANNAENYKALLATTCDKKVELANEITQCESELQQHAKPNHLVTYFSTDNCRKYDEYYECIKKIDVGCTDLQTAIYGIFHAVSEATPCAKHKTMKWMDLMS